MSIGLIHVIEVLVNAKHSGRSPYRWDFNICVFLYIRNMTKRSSEKK